jgi:diguanylate cyclase (GGDEF)-like protein/PAS domain S-box-containing protein
MVALSSYGEPDRNTILRQNFSCILVTGTDARFARVEGNHALTTSVPDNMSRESAPDIEDRLRRWLFDQLPQALTVKDTAGRYVLINKAAAALLGVENPQALRHKTDFDILPVEQAALLDDAEMPVRAGQILSFQAEAPDPATGKVRRLQTTKVPLTDDVGAFAGIASLACDLDAADDPRRQDGSLGLEEVLERERELLRTIIDSIPAKIYAKDMHSRFIACNVLVASEMGTTTAQAIGRTDFDFFPRPMAEGFFADEQAVIQSGRPLLGREELVLDKLSGTMRRISTTKVPFRDRDGNVLGIIGIGVDITERNQAEERIRHIATHDSLTDLPNRGRFSEVISCAIADGLANNSRFAILFVDLDHFKFINDSLGHEAGDVLLQTTAARLVDGVRSTDTVARLGGDEFVVLCREPCDREIIDGLAFTLLQALSRPVTLLGQERRVGASIGISIYPQDGKTERALLKNADTAMYTAKQEGRNNHRFFSVQLRSESLERGMLENELRRAIERNELRVHYLPKSDLSSGIITGAEALLRWLHPDLGLILPSRFLALAEETRLAIPICEWILHAVCRQQVAWQRQGLPAVCISVNLSRCQFYDEPLVQIVLEALNTSAMAASLLELEISEAVLMHDFTRSCRIVEELKRMGVRIAVQNFGASYLSLANIRTVPIDTLKVDRSLMRDIGSPETRALTDAIIAVARSLSLTVIAEGVETQLQADFAREHACDAMQGFYVSEPASAAEFAALLQQRLPPQSP